MTIIPRSQRTYVLN